MVAGRIMIPQDTHFSVMFPESTWQKKGFADVIKILDFESLKAENLSQGGQGLTPPWEKNRGKQ